MPQIRYSDAVRAQAVRLVLESQKPLTEVARKFGCSVSALQHWLKAHRQAPESPKPGGVKKFKQAVADKDVSPATFIPVNLIDQKSSTVEIITPNGFTLKLTDTHPRYIAELLGILGSC
jgi:hypothetical protein